MRKMTYEAYDALIEQFEQIQEDVPVCWPSIQQIDMFRQSPEEWLDYCIYLHECNPEPKTSTERYSKRNLADFIHDHLELVDTEG